VVGIIGRNGAGKSTLLKILSRITEPTSGRIELRGRVGSLLEVGTGFHPELTGRENIYMNGSILGMSRREIARKFDEIVDFAEIEDFLDTPVKRYSSGMYVRLAFAVAANLEPEILIVDEVLAVGDAQFQRKCLGKMHDIATTGRTVFFVSHNLAAIENLCSRSLLFREGRLVLDDHPRKAAAAFLHASATGNDSSDDAVVDLRHHTRRRPGSERILSQLCISSPAAPFPTTTIQTGGSLTFDIHFRAPESRSGWSIALFVCEQGQRLLMFHNRVNSALSFPNCQEAHVQCHVPSLPLIPGAYDIDIAIGTGQSVADYVDHAATLQVVESDYLSTGMLPKPTQARFVQPAQFTIVEVN
jgi:lipopolysaccharide transport system ATP-binding protein